MRILLVLLLWLFVVGGVGFYTSRSNIERRPSRRTAVVTNISSNCECRVWTSFSAAPDPFALNSDGDALVLNVLLNGKPILVRKGTLDGSSVQVSQITTGLVSGKNELFLETTPPFSEHDRKHAARLQLSRQGKVLVDKTFWSNGGMPLVTSVPFEVMGSE